MSLYKKIHAVMDAVKYLKKDDEVGEGKSKYKAISEEKVTTAIRTELIKQGLVILPIEQTSSRVDSSAIVKDNYGEKEKWTRMASVDTKYKIIDIDTGEFEILASSGNGVDSQDKGIGKAMTYSYKYLLLRTFAIPTGEDPDQIASEDFNKEDKPKKPQTLNPQQQLNKPEKTDLEKRADQIYFRCKNGFKWTDEQFKQWIKDMKESKIISNTSPKYMTEKDIIAIESQYEKLKESK